MQFLIKDNFTDEYLEEFEGGYSLWIDSFALFGHDYPDYFEAKAALAFETFNKAKKVITFLKKEFRKAGVSDEEIDFEIVRVQDVKCYKTLIR